MRETPGVEKAPGVSSPQRKESGRSGRDDGELRFGEYPRSRRSRSSIRRSCSCRPGSARCRCSTLNATYAMQSDRRAATPHRHGLTVEQMKRLSELMEHPVMLCDSPAREDIMLVVLRDVDCDDLPLIMAVRADGRDYYEAGEIETNFILAVYGRTNFPRYFDNLITPDRVVYYDEERGRELNALAKLQLLRSHIVEPDLVGTIIRQSECIVNSKSAGQDRHTLFDAVKECCDASSRLAETGTPDVPTSEKAGMNPKAMQYIMGHKDIKMTLGYYAHMDGCTAVEEMRRVAE